MSLPLKAIERLFDRLTATYGRDFTARFDGVDQNELKALWAHELSGFGDKLSMVAWALENLPERAPNIIEFRNLCRKAPAPETPRLNEPKADPERVKAEIEKLTPIISSAKMEPYDHKAWARRIIAREDAGEILNPTVARFAREALRHA
jgi:hypothetical protein